MSNIDIRGVSNGFEQRKLYCLCHISSWKHSTWSGSNVPLFLFIVQWEQQLRGSRYTQVFTGRLWEMLLSVPPSVGFRSPSCNSWITSCLLLLNLFGSYKSPNRFPITHRAAVLESLTLSSISCEKNRAPEGIQRCTKYVSSFLTSTTYCTNHGIFVKASFSWILDLVHAAAALSFRNNGLALRFLVPLRLSPPPSPPLTHSGSRYESAGHMWKHLAHGNNNPVQPVDSS